MIRSYLQGVPCWIDTEQPDPERARDFYSRVLSWTAEPVPGHDDYLVASLDEFTVAGIAGSARPQACWTTYLAVDDADAAAVGVADHDGTVRTQPFDLGDRGRAARCEDPAGARFGLWQAGEVAGVGVKNVLGAWDNSDLHCDDERAVEDFYGAIFGWEIGAVDIGAGQWATMLRVPGYGAHRVLQMSDQVTERDSDKQGEVADAIGWLAPVEPTDDGPCWRVTFAIADRDQVARAAERLGAEIISERDSRVSRTALVRDPQGALFNLSQALTGG